MTDKFTTNHLEQIKAVMDKYQVGCVTDVIIAELTKPVWTPQTGEVYAYQVDNGDEKFNKNQAKFGLKEESTSHDIVRRPLTPDEVPALKVAQEALDAVQKNAYSESSMESKIVRDALAKIKELTGE